MRTRIVLLSALALCSCGTDESESRGLGPDAQTFAPETSSYLLYTCDGLPSGECALWGPDPELAELPEGKISVPTAVSDGQQRLEVTTLWHDAFFRRPELVSLTLPRTLDSIGNRACARCENLQNIVFGSRTRHIGQEAFTYCQTLTVLKLPETVAHIGPEAFARCTALQAVTLPKGLDTLRAGTFAECIALAKVTLDNALRHIGDDCFNGCAKLPAITFTGSVASLGDRAFANCPTLTELTVPATLNALGDQCFYNCYRLQTVRLAGGARLGTNTFELCGNLQEVELPATLTRLPAGTFKQCFDLRGVDLPAALDTVDAGAFEEAFGRSNSQIVIVARGPLGHVDPDAFLNCDAKHRVKAYVADPAEPPADLEEALRVFPTTEFRDLKDYGK